MWIEIECLSSILSTRESPPARGCGLKFFNGVKLFNCVGVIPRTGVWIEMFCPFRIFATILPVTPRTGVWIEIVLWDDLIDFEVVTPRTGVWIEIFLIPYKKRYYNTVTPRTGVS